MSLLPPEFNAVCKKYAEAIRVVNSLRNEREEIVRATLLKVFEEEIGRTYQGAPLNNAESSRLDEIRSKLIREAQFTQSAAFAPGVVGPAEVPWILSDQKF